MASDQQILEIVLLEAGTVRVNLRYLRQQSEPSESEFTSIERDYRNSPEIGQKRNVELSH